MPYRLLFLISITQECHTFNRFILRVLPVEVTCYASEEEIGKAITPLITKYLPAESDTPKRVLFIPPGPLFSL